MKSLSSAGRFIGKGLGEYIEESAKSQHEQFKEWLWLDKMSEEGRMDVYESRRHQNQFDEMIYQWAEQRATIPKIVDLDLRKGRT